MQILIFFISFLLVYLLYYFMVLSKKDKLEKFKTSTEITYLKRVYHIKINQFDMKWLAKRVVLINSFIISLVVFFATLLDSAILMILLGFVLLFPTILIFYHILGKYLQHKKKEMK